MCEKKIDEKMSEMSLEEKVQLLIAYGLRIPVGDNPVGMEEYEVPREETQEQRMKHTTTYPQMAALAATWSTKTAYEMGNAIGRDARSTGMRNLFRPGVNIKRSPLCGRNFEYFSEDPVLSGKLAASYIRGMQKENVAATVKHFCVNNQEYERMVTSANVSERALREIYLTPFEIAIKEGDPWTLMTSYNRVNGQYVNSNKHLITDILRNEWGYNGVVTTDASAVHMNKVESHNNGVDSELNTLHEHDGEFLNAIYNHDISIQTVDEHVRRILTLMDRLDADSDIKVVDHEAQHALAVKAAEDGIILLKNSDNALPVSKDEKVVVIGAFAQEPVYCGGGSGHTNARYLDRTLEEMQKITNSEITYSRGYSIIDPFDLSELDEAVAFAQTSKRVILFLGIPFGEKFGECEAADRKDLDLPVNQKKLAERVLACNNNVILVVSAGSAVNLKDYADKATAVVFSYPAGEGMGKAIAEVLYGDAEPGGRLPETFPLRLKDTPAYNNFPSVGNPTHEVVYGEGVYVGYRWYDSRDIPVLYSFGHGLSYTTFEISNFVIDKTEMDKDQILMVSVSVKNTGSRRGSQVVQLYVHDECSSIDRPEKELKAFQKVILEPDEEEEVVFRLDSRAFAFYDEDVRKWVVEEGTFNIQVGFSSDNIQRTASVLVHSRDRLVNYTYDTAIQWILNAENLKEAINDFPEELKSNILNGLDSSMMAMSISMPCYRLMSDKGILPYCIPKEYMDKLLARLNR